MPARSVEAPDLEPLPDLVIEDFDVRIYNDRQEGLTTKYPFTATIKNLGSEAVTEPFYVNFEHILGEEGSWWVNRTESRAIRINHEIGPSEELPLSHFVTLSTTEISDTPVQVRAVVDSAEFEEFPPAHGHILESNEDNNTSSAVLIPVRYRPIVTGINKTEAIKGLDEVMLTGMGLGTADPGRTVVMEKDGNKLGAEVRQWSQGGVVFRVPQTADTGLYQVYIGESSSFYPLSEESKFLMVFNRRELPWEQLMGGFNLFLTGAFSIRLHTWSGGSGYDNLSEMTVFGEKEPVSLMVPLIQFKTNMGYYRFLLNEMNTLGLNDEELGFSLKREACADNQLRLVILFENEGKEMIGYYKVLGPAGKWRRTGAPDVHVNNARIEILFQFVDAGLGNMDYQAAVTFSGDVQASGSTWNTIIDLFMGGWDNNVKKKVATSVRQVINSEETRQKISQSLIGSIRLLAGLKKTDTIAGYDFTSEAIRVTYF
ncbi:MAG: hypothetical protein ACLFUE_07605 [Desulfobacteraceae bacterium]